MDKPTLMVIVGSTRPGRIGKPVSDWIVDLVKGADQFVLDVADLAEIALPMYDEPLHPLFGQYEHAHTLAWSQRVRSADAFVFITPEYNHGFNAAIKNAIDYLNSEWAYKPAGIVSYGGVSAGTRAAEMLRQVLANVRIVDLAESVNIPFVAQFVNDNGDIDANAAMETAAEAMLAELHRTSSVLVALRP